MKDYGMKSNQVNITIVNCTDMKPKLQKIKFCMEEMLVQPMCV